MVKCFPTIRHAIPIIIIRSFNEPGVNKKGSHHDSMIV
jgi:hypothetical protein